MRRPKTRIILLAVLTAASIGLAGCTTDDDGNGTGGGSGDGLYAETGPQDRAAPTPPETTTHDTLKYGHT